MKGQCLSSPLMFPNLRGGKLFGMLDTLVDKIRKENDA